MALGKAIGISFKKKSGISWSVYWVTHFLSDLTVTTTSKTAQTITATINGSGADGISWEYSNNGGVSYTVHGTSVLGSYNASGLTEYTSYLWRARLYKGINYGNYCTAVNSFTAGYANVTVIGKNKFDKNTVINNYELLSNGVSSSYANSKHSDYITIDDSIEMLAISGLTPYTGTDGYVCFYDASKVFISYVTMAKSITSITTMIPLTAKYLRHNIVRRPTGSEVINLDTIQTEWWEVTTYAAHSESVVNQQVDDVGSPIFTLLPGKNKFSKHKYLPGYEVSSGTGVITAYSTSSCTGHIPIPDDVTWLYLSGFTAYTGSNKNIVFYNSSKAFLSGQSTSAATTRIAIGVPPTAGYVVVEIVKRKTGGETINLDTIQIEWYGETTFETYAETLLNRLLYPLHDTTAYELKMLGFGDSLMETCLDWTVDGVTYTEGGRENWLTFAGGKMKLGLIRNYAASGAKWKDEGQAERLKLTTQVTTAINNNPAIDIIVANTGVNDGITNIGSFATAMGKATLADLDRSLLYETLRWCLWSLRTAYPTAKGFVGDILPNTLHAESYYADVNEAIHLMGEQYSFTYVDQTLSGIDTGTDLSDGLHPNHAGRLKLASFWETTINAQL